MSRPSNQEDYQKTALRVPRDLHAKIIESAKKHNRTMNAEIIERLEGSFLSGTSKDDLFNALNVIQNALQERGIKGFNIKNPVMNDE